MDFTSSKAAGQQTRQRSREARFPQVVVHRLADVQVHRDRDADRQPDETLRQAGDSATDLIETNRRT
jgi:hypothetical protein